MTALLSMAVRSPIEVPPNLETIRAFFMMISLRINKIKKRKSEGIGVHWGLDLPEALHRFFCDSHEDSTSGDQRRNFSHFVSAIIPWAIGWLAYLIIAPLQVR